MQNLQQAEAATPELLNLPAWQTYKQVTWIQTAVYLAVVWFIALRLRNRLVPQSVRDVKLFLLLAPPAQLLMELTAQQIAFGRSDTSGLAESVTRMIVVNTVWFLYFQFSKRVRNTYYPPKGLAAAAAPVAEQDSFAWRQEVVHGDEAHALATTATTSAPPAHGGAQERLATLRQLREQGLITGEDYERKKAEVLAKL